MRLVEIVKLASDVRPTRRLHDAPRLIKLVESRVTIRLQDARVSLQVFCWTLPLPVRRVSKPHGRRCFAARRPVIAHIRPQAARLRLAVARLQHWYWHIVAVQLFA